MHHVAHFLQIAACISVSKPSSQFSILRFFFSSVTDQQAKQSLHFSGGRGLLHADGRTLVASSSSVYAVAPIPLEAQLAGLMQAGNVEGALAMAEEAVDSGRWVGGRSAQQDRTFFGLNKFVIWQKRNLLRAEKVGLKKENLVGREWLGGGGRLYIT